MPASAQKAPQNTSRMSPEAIEEELFELREEHRRDLIAHEHRDFSLEAMSAENDHTQGHAMAEEIRATGVLFRRCCERRQARIAELEDAAQALQEADVTGTLDDLTKRHAQARKAAEKALAAIDFGLLDAFEAQVDAFLAEQQQVRNAAVEAATVAQRGGAKAPGLVALKSERVESLYDRLQRLAARIAAPDLQSRRDLSTLDVQRVDIG